MMITVSLLRFTLQQNRVLRQSHAISKTEGKFALEQVELRWRFTIGRQHEMFGINQARGFIRHNMECLGAVSRLCPAEMSNTVDYLSSRNPWKHVDLLANLYLSQ